MASLRRGIARLGQADRRAIALLLLLPVVVTTLPSLLGYPPITDDNLIQNYPLRAFSGELIAQGHWPLWNPFAWSGNALLASMNAGSLHPTTLLFAFLPGLWAWLGNLWATYWFAGLGAYALGRYVGLRPRPALLAASTYAFGGAMIGQLSHLGVVQAQGYIPLGLLAIFGLARHLLGARSGASLRAAGWYGLMLAVVLGLIVLVAEPRGYGEAEVVFAVAIAYALLRRVDRDATPGLIPRLRFLVATGLAGLLGLGLGAVQLAPGLGFIHSSQRAHLGYWFFASGSLPVRWSALLLMPNVFGGNGFANAPRYFMGYSLPEVTGYVGLLALVAVAVGVLQWIRAPREASTWRTPLWVVLAILGLTMAWGGFTPMGHVFHQLPFFGRTRLPSRNIAIFDLGAAMLLGTLVQTLSAHEVARWLADRWRAVALVGPALMAAMATWAFVDASGLERFMGARNAGDAALGHYLWPWFALQFAFAFACAAIIWFGPRWSASRRVRVASWLVALDLVAFVASSGMGLLSGHDVVVEPNRAQAAAVLGTKGRFAVVNSAQDNLPLLSKLGPPNQNVFTKLGSVEGYGSLTDVAYDDATGTHGRNKLDPCAVKVGRTKQLRLASIVAWAGAYSHYVSPTPTTTRTDYTAPGCQHDVAGAPGTPRTLWFGRSVKATRIDIYATADAGALRNANLAFELLDGRHHTGASAAMAVVLAAPVHPGHWVFHIAGSGETAGVTLNGPAASVASIRSTFTDDQGNTWRMDGPWQLALDPAQWQPSSVTADYQAFAATSVAPAFAARGGVVRSSRETDWGLGEARVSMARPGALVRSVAFAKGWTATATNAAGEVRVLEVVPHHLVQAVQLPAGEWRVTFSYRPRAFTLGLWASVLSLLALLLAAAGLWLMGRRQDP